MSAACGQATRCHAFRVTVLGRSRRALAGFSLRLNGWRQLQRAPTLAIASVRACLHVTGRLSLRTRTERERRRDPQCRFERTVRSSQSALPACSHQTLPSLPWWSRPGVLCPRRQLASANLGAQTGPAALWTPGRLRARQSGLGRPGVPSECPRAVIALRRPMSNVTANTGSSACPPPAYGARHDNRSKRDRSLLLLLGVLGEAPSARVARRNPCQGIL
jgi:hypothetical protein